MAGKPDEDNIRWNNTTLSSLAETCFFASSECGLGRDRERVGRGGCGGMKHSERSVLCRKLNHLKIHSARTESPKIEGIRRRGFGFVDDVEGRSGFLVRPVTIRSRALQMSRLGDSITENPRNVSTNVQQKSHWQANSD